MTTTPSTTYLATRATVRAVFWTALAATPYLLAGLVSALVGDPLLIANQ